MCLKSTGLASCFYFNNSKNQWECTCYLELEFSWAILVDEALVVRFQGLNVGNWITLGVEVKLAARGNKL